MIVITICFDIQLLKSCVHAFLSVFGGRAAYTAYVGPTHQTYNVENELVGSVRCKILWQCDALEYLFLCVVGQLFTNYIDFRSIE